MVAGCGGCQLVHLQDYLFTQALQQFIHSYTATLASLLVAHTKKSSVMPTVGVVGVTHTGGGSDYLPGVKQEVHKIISVVKQPQGQCLQNHQATVDAVKLQLQDCSWIHLACH